MITHYILTFVVCYVIGCLPSALIISKIFSNKDPGKLGSGNYGALNSYEITGKKYVGAFVLLLDALKGAAAVLITHNLIDNTSIFVLLAAFAVVVGHCYNVFLRFRGGRGLATALGALLVFNPLLVVVWGIVWIVVHQLVRRDVSIANKVATIAAPIVLLLLPSFVIVAFNYNSNIQMLPLHYRCFAVAVCIVIFIAHLRCKK
jgi:glycerol-3-phosphate acyltransferase PlsY